MARSARSHALFIAVLGVGAALRVLTSIAYRPALEYVQDSFGYLEGARRLVPDVIRPAGYSAFLRLLAPTGELAVVPAVQHLLGLLMGVMLYALLRRLGARTWVAALGAAPAVLDAYQVYVEHFVMAEALFQFLVVAALVLLLWQERPNAVVCAAAGVLLAGAAVTRTVGVLLLVPALGYLLVRRVGLWRIACTLGAAGVLLGGYGAWFQARNGRFGLQAYEGYFLAGRVMPFADCRRLRLPEQEQPLCDPRPVSQRPGPDWYDWNPGSPLRRPEVPPGTDRNQVAGDFARRIIRHQPGDYLRTVGGDVVHYFAWSRTTGPRDNPVESWQFRTSFTPHPWQPEYPPADPYVWAWTWPGPSVEYGVVVASHGFDLAQVRPALNRPVALSLRRYQRYGYVPGPVLALALLMAVASGVGRLRPSQRRLRAAALTMSACSMLLLVAPPATAAFDYRYLLPAQTLLLPAGALGMVLLEQRLGPRRGQVWERDRRDERTP